MNEREKRAMSVAAVVGGAFGLLWGMCGEVLLFRGGLHLSRFVAGDFEAMVLLLSLGPFGAAGGVLAVGGFRAFAEPTVRGDAAKLLAAATVGMLGGVLTSLPVVPWISPSKPSPKRRSLLIGSL
jgi:hypothetical protein